MASAAFTDAFVLYGAKYPTKDSLGVNAATWLADLAAVSPEAFDGVKALALNFDGGGGSMSGVANFDQMQKVRALYAVRALRDADFVNPYTVEPPLSSAGWRLGSVVRLEGGCR